MKAPILAIRQSRSLGLWLACIALLVAALGAGTVPAFAAETTSVSIDVTYDQTSARSMINDINDFRAGEEAWYWNEGNKTKTELTGTLEPLAYDYDLERVAMQRAAEIAIRWGHARPSGEDTWSAFTEYGNGVSFWAKGENIALGQTSVGTVMTAWKEADRNYDGQGHRRNMLDGNFNCVGIGHVVFQGTHYWVQDFGKRDGASTETAVTNGEQTVGIDVANEQLSTPTVSASFTNLTVFLGDSVDEPTISATAQIWGVTKELHVPDYSWTIMDDSVVSMSGGKITGLTEGQTTLTTNFDLSGPRTVDVNVKVLPKDLSYADISVAGGNQYAIGTPAEPAVTLKLGGVVLQPRIDYDIEYSNNENAGVGRVKVTGKNGYTGSKEATFTIAQRSLYIPDISGYYAYSATYNGRLQNPLLFLNDNGTPLVFEHDYTGEFSGGDGISVGTMTARAKGIGNYTNYFMGSSKQWDFTIKQLDLSNSNVSVELDESAYDYDGSPKCPQVTVSYGDFELPKSDYKVTYENNTLPSPDGSRAKAIITATSDNVTGSRTVEFDINPVDISSADMWLAETEYVYNGSPWEPVVNVKLGDRTLSYGTDFTVEYADNTHAGTASAFVSGVGGYTGNNSLEFTIARAPITANDITLEGAFTYTGQPAVPGVTVKVGENTLKENEDYNLSIANNIDATENAHVRVLGVGDYDGDVIVDFAIERASIQNAQVELDKYVYIYDGNDKTPKVTIRLGETELSEGKDFTVTYGDNTNAGQDAHVDITGIGNYAGALRVEFAILSQDGEATVTENGVDFTYKLVSDKTGSLGSIVAMITKIDANGGTDVVVSRAVEDREISLIGENAFTDENGKLAAGNANIASITLSAENTSFENDALDVLPANVTFNLPAGSAAQEKVNVFNDDKATAAATNIEKLLPEGDVALTDADAVAEARKIYEGLTDAQKACDAAKLAQAKLAKAEDALAKLTKEQDDKVQAVRVERLIAALPDAAEAKAADADAVAAAQAAYDKLTEDQKKLVNSEALTKLSNVKARVDELVAEAQGGSGDGSGSGDTPGSGDNSGTGDNPVSGDKPGSGDNPSSGDNPGSGDDQDSDDGDETDTDGSEADEPLAEGATATAGLGAAKALYKVTKAASGTQPGEVVYIKTAVGRAAKSASVPATVSINGKNYRVVGIAASAFKGAPSLASVSIGKNVTSVSAKAFAGCAALKTVSGGGKVASLGKAAFKGCKNLTSVGKLSNSKKLVSIGKAAFRNCAALTKFVVGKKVKSVGAQAFAGCKNLKSLTIGKSVTKVGAKAFAGCSKLKTINIKSTKLANKAAVKNMLKGSSVVNVKLKMTANAKKGYSATFAKATVGKSVMVK